MDEMGDEGANTALSPENKDVVRRIAAEIMEPALQKALSMARDEGTPQEAFSALTNCYGSLLVDLLGRQAAAKFLQNHAIYIASLEEKPISS